MRKEKKNILCRIACGFVLLFAVLFGMQTADTQAEDPFESDAFSYGTIPSEEALLSKKEVLSGKEWTGKDNAIDVTQVNVTPVNAATISYQDKRTAFYGARDYKREESASYQLLTDKGNDWELTVVSNPQEAEKLGAFEQASYEEKASDGWKSVTLPASWTSYGFDYSIYTNTKMPFQEEVNFPEAPVSSNPVGLYRKEFVVKDSMQQENGRIYLTFAGVESAYYVYVNGTEVGYSEDSYNGHSFDITDYLMPKGQKNILAVKVYKFCDGTWLEDQDMIYDGGIFRDVYLTNKPNVSISDYKLTTNLQNAYQSAELTAEISVQNNMVKKSEKLGVECTLYRDDGAVAANGVSIIGAAASGEGVSGTVTLQIKEPSLWDADHPNLYTVVISLYSADSRIHYESVSQNVGFRSLTYTGTEIDGEEEYNHTTTYYQTVRLNGKRLLLKGVNRHDTDPETGKYVSHEVYEADIKLMKQNNINALRTSHYANDDYLYYLCDKYGIYLMCETNMESHAIQNQESSLAILEKACMDRQKTAFARLKNVTANLMWSIGNESTSHKAKGSFANGMFSKMICYFKKNDPTRMVHYEGVCSYMNKAAGGVDMISQMYIDISKTKKGAELTNHMPFLLCEYDHAMGNGVGNLKEYWDIIRANDNMLGGFIWDWVDQSRKLPLSEGDWDYYAQKGSHQSGLHQLAGFYLGYGGDWGEGIHDGTFCQNGLVSADRDAQPELKEVRYQYQDFQFSIEGDKLKNNTVSIKNESQSKRLSDYELVWELKENDTVISDGVLIQELSAGEEKKITVPYQLPTKKKDGAEYYLNLSVRYRQDNEYAKEADELAYAQFPIAAASSEASCAVNGDGITATEKSGSYLIQGNSFSFEINKTNGIMEKYRYRNKLLLEKGPVVNFDRALLDNDYLSYGMVSDTLSLNGEIRTEKDAYGRYVITVPLKTEDIRSEKNGTILLQEIYTIDGSGAVTIQISYDFSNLKTVEYTKVGTILTLPKGNELVSWYGNGDGESYSDRQSYTRVGTYTSTVDDMFYPFLKPQDCGNLTDVRWIRVCGENGTGVLVAAKDTVNASALHFTPQMLNSAGHVKDLTPSEKTYLTLDAAVAGTGNASCGYKTLEKYQVKEKQYTLSYTLLPVTKSSDCMKLSKQYSAKAKVTKKKISAKKKPVKVTGVSVKKSSKKLTVSWKEQSGCKYVAYYSTKKAALSKIKKGSQKVSGVKRTVCAKNRTVLKAAKKQKYYIKICAFQTQNGKKTYGTFSKVIKK